MNRIKELFRRKKENILSIFFTAGYPSLHDTATIIKALSESGADMIEIGFPFSDPMADGPVIQNSSKIALKNGMSLNLLFEQLSEIRKHTQIPLLLMGYLNPVIKMGFEKFLEKCSQCGIDGVILPDLPVDLYISDYKNIFEKYSVFNILLITPQTSEERIRLIDEASHGFIYAVSSYATTGIQQDVSENQKKYFEKIKSMNLKNPFVIGFGISDNASFKEASKYSQGAIVGSAFIKAISEQGILQNNIIKFIKNFENQNS